MRREIVAVVAAPSIPARRRRSSHLRNRQTSPPWEPRPSWAPPRPDEACFEDLT